MLDDKLLMEELKISSTQKTYYLYKNFRYENLRDAVNYVEIENARQKKRNDSR